MPGYSEIVKIGNPEILYEIHRLPWGQNGDPESMRGVLAAICKLIQNKGGSQDLDIGSLIVSVLSSLSDPEIGSIFAALGNQTLVTIQGTTKRLSIDYQNLHWSDYPDHFARWLAEALKVNYASFFRGAQSAQKEVVAALGSLNSNNQNSIV
jgi:hypothetical protein